MTATKHPKGSPFPDDLDRNPGIGQSKASFATAFRPMRSPENRLEGDVDKDMTATDGLPEEERERTNA